MVITEYNMSDIDAMEGHEFEHFIAALLRQLGYQKVEVTRGSGDQGVDVLAEKDDIRYAVQCKCYTTDLGNTPIQEVNTGKMIYQCHVGVVVTNRYFTQSAREAAKATGVLLWDRAKLEKMLAQVQGTSNIETLTQQSKDSIVSWSGSPLLQRGAIALKDREWKKAVQFFDRVLNTDPENAEAYLGIVMAEAELSDIDEFMKFYGQYPHKLDEKNLNHVKEFARPELSAWFIEEDQRIEKLGKKRKNLIICLKRIKEKKEKELEREREEKHKETIVQLTSIRDSLKRLVSPILVSGSKHIVGLKADGTVVAAGDNQHGQCNVSDWRDIVAVACGQVHTVGLKANGTVVATGANRNKQCNVSEWKDIVAVVCSSFHTIGLKADGTVVITEESEYHVNYGHRDIPDWRDIMAVTCNNSLCSNEAIIGLKADGTVIATSDENDKCNVSSWQDIVAVACGTSTVIGLKTNGAVVITGDEDGEYDVSDWRNIVAVDCRHLPLGLKADGTVVGFNLKGKANWTDLVSITTGDFHNDTVGLKSDGTVVVEGADLMYDGNSNVSSWMDIVAVTVAGNCIAGLKSNGSVVITGMKITRIGQRIGQIVHRDWCDILEWDLLNNLDALIKRQSKTKACLMAKVEEKQRQQTELRAKLKAEFTMKKAALKSERNALSTELASLKGLFTGKRRREIKERLVEISKEEWNLYRQENNHGE